MGAARVAVRNEQPDQIATPATITANVMTVRFTGESYLGELRLRPARMSLGQLTLPSDTLRWMSRRWLTALVLAVAVVVAAIAVWGAIALPTGHYRVAECLRPDHRCVGPEDFRYPQRIAILVGGALITGTLVLVAIGRRFHDSLVADPQHAR